MVSNPQNFIIHIVSRIKWLRSYSLLSNWCKWLQDFTYFLFPINVGEICGNSFSLFVIFLNVCSIFLALPFSICGVTRDAQHHFMYPQENIYWKVNSLFQYFHTVWMLDLWQICLRLSHTKITVPRRCILVAQPFQSNVYLWEEKVKIRDNPLRRRKMMYEEI